MGNLDVEKSHKNGWKRCMAETKFAALIISLALLRASLLQSQAYTMMVSLPLQEHKILVSQFNKHIL